jgi:RNA polymerase sigma factor (sigma-70 family)
MPRPQDDSDPLPPADNLQPQSIDEVWRRYGEQLRRRARTRLRQYGLSGQAESMDICNDVMADFVRRANIDKAGVEDIMSYIFRAIDNQVLDTFRTLARQCRDFRRVDATSIEEMPLGTSSPTPSQIAIRREVLDRVRHLLGPEDARVVDMMLENRDWKEIGTAIGIEPDAARMRVRRALDRVRALFAVADTPSQPGTATSR